MEFLAKDGYHAHMSAATARTAKPPKVSVLLTPDEAERFEAYCRSRGFKKSTLIARLIREYLDSERFQVQRTLFDANPAKRGRA